MMMGALIHQHSYKTFLKDKSNDVLVLYISRMMIGVLSHQHLYNTVYNDKPYVVLVLICNVDLT